MQPMIKAAYGIRGICRAVWCAGIAVWILLFSLPSSYGAVLQDYFTNRETINTTNGTLLGNNSTATFEVGEPKHGGKPGGHSLWISWVAPTNGVATFDTHGSGFDTLLSAYVLNPTNATTVDKLQEQARNDDDPATPPTSLIQIGAIAGHSYEIAVDGYEGATGTVVFNWSFTPSASPPPIIVSTPNDQSAKQGDLVTLSVNMVTSSSLQLAWFFNGVEDTNQNTTNYIISSLQDTNVGRYQLRITIGNGNNRVRYFTTPVEIQINSEGSTNTLAQDKLLDSTASPLIGDDGSGPPHPSPRFLPPSPAIGVVRGYSGSQVFNTTFATTDPSEPSHCGFTGGASYWLLYQPPANGTMTLDTVGSSYDTLMEVYTYNGALTSYANLISVGCDNDSFYPHGPSRVSFQAISTRQYVVVVDGINGAKGTAWLNYVLNTGLPAQAPTLQSQVSSQTVTPGATVTLAPSITGAPPMNYSWSKNGVAMGSLPVPFLQFTNMTTDQSADYSITAANDLGSIVVTVPVHVVPPHICSLRVANSGLNLSFPTVAGFHYTIEKSTNLLSPWSAWSPAILGNGQTFSTNFSGNGLSFFRLRIQ